MEETGCEENLTAGTSFLDREYCGGENGIILSSPDSGIWERCSVRLSGNVTGMASSDDRCLVVTDAFIHFRTVFSAIKKQTWKD